MFCKNCGQQIPDGSTVCFQCGTAQNAAPQAQQYQQPYGQQPYGQQPMYAAPVAPKSKIVAILLCFFLGGWGIHDFYLGYTKNGILKIVLLFVTLGFGTAIWALIDFVRLLIGSINTDANGTPLA